MAPSPRAAWGRAGVGGGFDSVDLAIHQEGLALTTRGVGSTFPAVDATQTADGAGAEPRR